jgi:protein-disulfide isomerase
VLTVEPEVIEKYVRPGRVKLVFRDVLNHGERSIRTAEAAQCAGLQGQFWQMHELLFARQDEAARTPSAEMMPLMQRWGAELPGLDAPAYNTCLSERRMLGGIQAADAEQRRRGITSQPIFEIGTRRLFGLQTLDQISALVDGTR